MAGLENVRATPYRAEGPPVALAESVQLTSQERSYALSRTNVARLVLPASVGDLAWFQPAARWVIESDLGMPPWTGYVDAFDETTDGEGVELTLVDPVGAVLEDTRTEREVVLTRTAGEAVRRLLREEEAWSPTGISIGRIDAGPTADDELRATSLEAGLEQLTAIAPGYDWWLETTVGEGLDVALNWGAAGRDRRTEILRDGAGGEIKRAGHRWSRSGLVQSVAVLGEHYRFPDRPGAELVTNGQGRGDIAAFAGPGVQTSGPAGRRELVAVQNRSMSEPMLRQRAEAILVRTLELAHTLELELHLTNARVQSIALGDRFSVSLPTLMAGQGLEGVVRVLGYEPHEEDGRLDAIVTVEEVTPV